MTGRHAEILRAELADAARIPVTYDPDLPPMTVYWTDSRTFVARERADVPARIRWEAVKRQARADVRKLLDDFDARIGDGTTPDAELNAWSPNLDGRPAPWRAGDCHGHEPDGHRTRWCYCRRNDLRFPQRHILGLPPYAPDSPDLPF